MKHHYFRSQKKVVNKHVERIQSTQLWRHFYSVGSAKIKMVQISQLSGICRPLHATITSWQQQCTQVLWGCYKVKQWLDFSLRKFQEPLRGCKFWLEARLSSVIIEKLDKEHTKGHQTFFQKIIYWRILINKLFYHII